MKFSPVLEGLRWCNNCLTMSTRPRITFDERGWCNACVGTEKKKKIDSHYYLSVIFIHFTQSTFVRKKNRNNHSQELKQLQNKFDLAAVNKHKLHKELDSCLQRVDAATSIIER